jgi:small multidrug resistance family-3 protein
LPDQGCLRQNSPLPWVIIVLCSVVATLQPITAFGRVYAAYGGIFIALTRAGGVLVEGWRPDRYGVLGALIAVLGVLVMIAPPPVEY